MAISGVWNHLEIFAYGAEGGVRFSLGEPDSLDVFRVPDDPTAHRRLRLGTMALADPTAVLPAETTSNVLPCQLSSTTDARSIMLSYVHDNLGRKILNTAGG